VWLEALPAIAPKDQGLVEKLQLPLGAVVAGSFNRQGFLLAGAPPPGGKQDHRDQQHDVVDRVHGGIIAA